MHYFLIGDCGKPAKAPGCGRDWDKLNEKSTYLDPVNQGMKYLCGESRRRDEMCRQGLSSESCRIKSTVCQYHIDLRLRGHGYTTEACTLAHERKSA